MHNALKDAEKLKEGYKKLQKKNKEFLSELKHDKCLTNCNEIDKSEELPRKKRKIKYVLSSTKSNEDDYFRKIKSVKENSESCFFEETFEKEGL